MTTRPAPVAPDWLVPGAKVVVHSSYGGTQRASRAEVAKVAVHSFTVTGSPIRFRIDDQKHYDDTTRRLTQVVPEDSPEGQKLLAASRRRMKTKRARDACQEWAREGTRETRLAAIAALQAVED